MDSWYRHGIDSDSWFRQQQWYWLRLFVSIGTPDSHTYKKAECCPYAGFFYWTKWPQADFQKEQICMEKKNRCGSSDCSDSKQEQICLGMCCVSPCVLLSGIQLISFVYQSLSLLWRRQICRLLFSPEIPEPPSWLIFQESSDIPKNCPSTVGANVDQPPQFSLVHRPLSRHQSTSRGLCHLSSC